MAIAYCALFFKDGLGCWVASIYRVHRRWCSLSEEDAHVAHQLVSRHLSRAVVICCYKHVEGGTVQQCRPQRWKEVTAAQRIAVSKTTIRVVGSFFFRGNPITLVSFVLGSSRVNGD